VNRNRTESKSLWIVAALQLRTIHGFYNKFTIGTTITLRIYISNYGYNMLFFESLQMCKQFFRKSVPIIKQVSFTNTKHSIKMSLVIYSAKIISGWLWDHRSCSWWSGRHFLWTEVEYVLWTSHPWCCIASGVNTSFFLCMLSVQARNLIILTVKKRTSFRYVSSIEWLFDWFIVQYSCRSRNTNKPTTRLRTFLTCVLL
jgi:hypothetical protein